jgi:hypothetical protein
MIKAIPIFALWLLLMVDPHIRRHLPVSVDLRSFSVVDH